MEEFMTLALKSRDELNEMFDSGVFNPILKGYLILTMRENHIEDEIASALNVLDETLEYVNAQEARAAWEQYDF